MKYALAISGLMFSVLLIIGLFRGWIITWGSYSDEELKDMGVDLGRNRQRE